MKKKTCHSIFAYVLFSILLNVLMSGVLAAEETAVLENPQPAAEAGKTDSPADAPKKEAEAEEAKPEENANAERKPEEEAPEQPDVASLLEKAQRFELSDELYSAQNNYQQALQQAMELAAQNKESSYNYAVAEFITEKLLELTLRTADNRSFLRILESFSENSKAQTPHILQSRMDWAKIELYLRTGRADKAAPLSKDALKLKTRWLLSKGESATGRMIDLPSPDGFVCPGEYVPPSDWKKLRLHSIINSPKRQIVTLRLGFNADTHIYVNGSQVLSEDNGASAGFDRSVVAAELQKGENLLTVELTNAEKSPRGYLRITGLDGAPTDVTTQKAEFAPEQIETLWKEGKGKKASPVDAEVDTGALKLLAALIRTDPADHNSAYYLGYLLQRRQSFGPHSKEARELLMKAIRQEPDAGIYYLAFASAADESAKLKPDRDENLKRMMLQKAISISDKNIAALCLLGEYYLNSQNSPTRAQDYVQKALKKNPSSISANILQGYIYLSHDWSTQALKLAQDLSRRNRSFPEVCAFRALAEMAIGTPQEAENAWRIQLAANQLDTKLTSKLALSLRNRGEIKKALSVLTRYLSLRPDDTSLLRMRARFAMQAGETEDAQTLVSALLKINPDSAPTLKLAGKLSQKKGEQKKALEYFQKSLTADPGQPQLRDYLAFEGKTEPGLLDEIPNLAEFVAGFQNYHPAAGESNAIFLTETADQMHTDGTRQRSFHRVAKIFTREGVNNYLRFPVWHDATNEIVKVRLMRVLHPDGAISVGQSINIPRGEDRRLTLITLPGLQAGDVVELAYDIIQTRPGFFGDYFGVNYSFRQFAPALKSRYVLRYPKSRKLYFHQTPGVPEPTVQTEGDYIIRSWQMDKLPALKMLPLMPPLQEMSPTLQVCSFANWDDMAKWYWRLIKSQNISTEAIRKEVARIAPKNKSPREKLSAIYQWVSKNVRNNAWEFGIHGYKPYNAEAIFTRRFGDCKDKATLVNVMAREAGFEAWPVLLRAVDPSDNRAGRGQENLELPLISHFNHCISMVEAGGERYYLDPTIGFQTIDSQSMTDRGAGAIIVRPAGAEKVKLPGHTPQSNQWEETMRVEINTAGTADMNFAIKASGQPAMFLRSWFRNPATWDNVMNAIGTQLYGRVSSATVDNFTTNPGKKDTVSLRSRIRVRDYATSEKNSLQLSIPRIFVSGEIGKGGAVPDKFSSFAKQTVRELPLILPTLYTLKRSITIEWPDGWELTQNLQPIKLDKPFGTLEVKYALNDNLLQIDYFIQLKKQQISTEEYREFRRFCLQADQAAAQQLEIRRIQ